MAMCLHWRVRARDGACVRVSNWPIVHGFTGKQFIANE